MFEALLPARRRGTTIAALAAFASVLALAGCGRAHDDTPATTVAAPQTAKTTAAESPAGGIYEHSFSDADGQSQSLGQWRGKRLVLNFWATWCAPCVAEMPDLEKAQAEFAGADVAIVGLGTEDAQRVRAFRDRIGLRLKLLAGGYDALLLARALGNTQGVLPYTVLVSADGTVLQTQTGPLRPGQLREWLAAKP